MILTLVEKLLNAISKEVAARRSEYNTENVSYLNIFQLQTDPIQLLSWQQNKVKEYMNDKFQKYSLLKVIH